MDVELELAAPIYTRGFGDLKFFGDADEAPAFGAEADEPLLFFDVIHSFDTNFDNERNREGWTSAVQGSKEFENFKEANEGNQEPRMALISCMLQGFSQDVTEVEEGGHQRSRKLRAESRESKNAIHRLSCATAGVFTAAGC